MTGKNIVGIGGTTRAGSSSERLVSAVLAQCKARGAKTQMFGGHVLSQLPHYSPENPQRTPEQKALVEAVRAADGLVIGSPSYHGGISGLVKNAIDLLEDTRADDRVYFDGLPVGLCVTTAGWQSVGVTLGALRSVVHAMRGWPTPLGIGINTIEVKLGDGPGISHANVQASVEIMAGQILGFGTVK